MKRELDSTIKKPHVVLRAIRSQPHLYSAISKARLFYSRYVKAAAEQAEYKRHKHLFAMSAFEAKHSDELRNQGFTVLSGFFSPALIDRLYNKSDSLLKELLLDHHDSYSVQKKKAASLEGLTYQELESSEKMISLKDPLVNVPECVDMAFNESILKIVTNSLGYIPPRYKTMIVRDFPLDRPRESSNFHKDNDECDSLQVFIYLVDIDDAHGPLTYVPETNHYDVKSCKPRLTRDLGINACDGRISDSEIEKFYPKDTWAVLKVKRGSVAIIHGNGFHKGPCWMKYGDPANKPRTALRIDVHGYSMLGKYRGGRRIEKEAYDRLSELQKLFTKWHEVVN